METMENKRELFRAAPETRLLYQRLMRLDVGETVTYGDLSRVAGVDVRLDGRPRLGSAFRMCAREGHIIKTVWGVGVKRLSDDEILDLAPKNIRKMGRLAKRAQREVSHVDYDGLADDKKVEFNVTMSQLAVMQMLAKPKVRGQIEAEVTRRAQELPSKDILRLLSQPLSQPKT
jgi:hypothetical protein